jgi:hypothetical protein
MSEENVQAARGLLDAFYLDGKGAEFRWFTDESEALKAAGIEDHPGA